MRLHNITSEFATLLKNYWSIRTAAIRAYGAEWRPDPTICEHISTGIAAHLSEDHSPNLVIGGHYVEADGAHLWNLVRGVSELSLIDGSWYQGHYTKRIRLHTTIGGLNSGELRRLVALLDLRDLGQIAASRRFRDHDIRGRSEAMSDDEIMSLRRTLLPHMLRIESLRDWADQEAFGYYPTSWNKQLGSSFGAPPQ